jgi:hypothetical protein
MTARARLPLPLRAAAAACRCRRPVLCVQQLAFPFETC